MERESASIADLPRNTGARALCRLGLAFAALILPLPGAIPADTVDSEVTVGTDAGPGQELNAGGRPGPGAAPDKKTINAFLDWAHGLPPLTAAGWLLAANLVSFAGALLAGDLAARLFASHRVVPPADPLKPREIFYTAAGIAVNWLITIAGWFLWRDGIVVIGRESGWGALLDAAVLVLLMDLTMYVLHRVVHRPCFYPIHRLHHEFDRPRPLSLFVLNPLETLAFGLLWLLVIALYPSSFLGLSIYLAINLGMGMLGHLGVEPFPGWWGRVPFLRQVGTSTFHAQHHQDVHHNFGFYTLLWDRLFGTLVPTYDARFGESLPAPPARG